MMNKFFVAVILLLSFTTCAFAQVVEDSQFNANLTKSEDVRWIDDDFYYLHSVGVKQTMYSISKLYNVSIDDILKDNNLSSTAINTGQLLKIRAKDIDRSKYETKAITHAVTEIVDTANFIYIKIIPKETLYHLSHEYGVSIDEIKSANNGLVEGLKAGTTVKIPKKQKLLPEVANIDTANAVAQKITDTITAVVTNVVNENIVAANAPDTLVTFIEHKVSAYDNLASLAKTYSITAEDIIKYNPKAARKLKKNRMLRIPVYEILDKVDEIVSDIPNAVVEQNADKENRKQILNPKGLPCNKVGRKLNVALLMPLYYKDVATLEVSNENGNIISGSQKPFKFIHYYQGALIALDSLAKQGLDVELFVYDVDETQSSAEKIVRENSLKNIDLIVGPFYKYPYRIICDYAKSLDIPIVNPTTTTAVYDCSEMSFKYTTDDKTMLTYIANYILVNYPKANIIIYTKDTPDEKLAENIAFVKERITKAIPEKIKYQNLELYNFLVKVSAADTTLNEGELFDTLIVENRVFTKNQLLNNVLDYTTINNTIKFFDYSVDGVGGYDKYMSINRPNVVISFAEDNSGVLDNISRLSGLSDKYDVHLFGQPSWITKELDYTAIDNVDLHLCINGIIDYNKQSTNEFINKFSGRFITEPNRFAYLGFDSFYFFVNMLYRFDKDFPRYISAIHYSGLCSSVFFNKTDEKLGYENFSSGIYKIDDYEWKLLPSDDYIWNNISVDLETYIDNCDN